MRSLLLLFPARMSRDIRREALKQHVEQGGDTSRQELVTALIAGIPLTSHRIGPSPLRSEQRISSIDSDRTGRVFTFHSGAAGRDPMVPPV